jgi:hypothetical protein
LEPRGGLSVSQEQVRFALENFEPGLVSSGEIAEGIYRQILDGLARLGDTGGRASGYQGFGIAPVGEMELRRRGLQALVTMDKVDPVLLRRLIDYYGRAFVGEPDWRRPNVLELDALSIAGQELKRLLQKTIPTFGEVGPQAIAQLLDGIRRRNYLDVMAALFGLQLDRGMLPNLIRMFAILDDSLGELTVEASSVRLALRLVWELAEVLWEPTRLESYRSSVQELPYFESWLNDRRFSISALGHFTQTLESAFSSSRYRPEVVLAVGSTYLSVCPNGHYGLFEKIYYALDRDAGPLSDWLEQSPERAPRSRVIFLVRLLSAASARSNLDAESCWKKIGRVLDRLRPEIQTDALFQFQRSLAGKNVPKAIYREIEAAASVGWGQRPDRGGWW